MKNLKNIDFSKYYDDAKFAGIVAGIALLIWFSYKFLKKVSGEDPNRNIDIEEDNLSISETDAQLIAENLLNAMNRFGTDNELVYEEFKKIETKEDAILVSEKFGFKKYDGYGHGAVLGQPKNLKGWINAELTENEKQPIKQKLNWI